MVDKNGKGVSRSVSSESRLALSQHVPSMDSSGAASRLNPPMPLYGRGLAFMDRLRSTGKRKRLSKRGLRDVRLLCS